MSTISVTSPQTAAAGNQYVVENGGVLIVPTGVTISDTLVQAGGTETVSSGTVSSDTIYGVVSLAGGSATGDNETVESGGVLSINGKSTALNETVAGGGTIVLASTSATLTGTLTFQNGGNTLVANAIPKTAGSNGDLAVINGFSATDKIDVAVIGAAGATLSAATVGGNEDVTISGASGSTSVSETFIFANATTYAGNDFYLVPDSGSGVDLDYSSSLTFVSAGTSTGAQVASGAVLDVLTGGTVVSATVSAGGAEIVNGGSDQAATILAGGVERVYSGAVSGGQIYGVVSTMSGGAAIFTSETVENGGVLDLLNGNSAVGATVLDGGLLFISGANGATTGTVLNGGGTLDLDSAKATVSGSLTFEGGDNTLDIASIAAAGSGELATISGFSATDKINVTALGAGASLTVTAGASTTTATVTAGANSESFIFSGTTTYTGSTLDIVTSGAGEYLEYDANGWPTGSFDTLAPGSYTGLTVSATETLIVPAGASVTGTTVQNGGNLVISGGVDNATTVLVGGKEIVSAGSASGDQISGGATIYAGASVTDETVQNSGILAISGGSDAGSLIRAGGIESIASGSAKNDSISGSATVAAGATVSNETVANGGSLDVSGLDTVTTVALGGSEIVAAGGSASGDLIYGALTVSGATISNETIEKGGLATLGSGAVDTGMIVSAGGNVLVSAATGSATLSNDLISGVVSTISGLAATYTHETVASGGFLYLDNANNAKGTTVLDGGALVLSGHETATDTTLSGGGLLELDSPKATLSGSLTFVGGDNELELADSSDAGYGDLAVISGFSSTSSSTDQIDITSAAYAFSDLTLSQAVVNGNTVATVMSGGVSGVVVETFTFAGASLDGDLTLVSDNNGGSDLEIAPKPGTTEITGVTVPGAFTVTDAQTLLVIGGGSVTAPTIENGGFLTINGGVDSGAIVQSGALETISAGSASGDQIYGSALVLGGAVSNEIVERGGVLNVDPGTASNIVLNGGATLDVTGADAVLSGSLTFANGDNTLIVPAALSGDGAVISGYSTNDKIEIAGMSASGATLTFASGSNGEEIATVANGGVSQSFTFANSTSTTYDASTMSLAADGSNVDLVLDSTPVIAFTTRNELSTNQADYAINGQITNIAADPYAIGSTVDVYESGSIVGSATVQANGYWQADVALGVTDGANVLSASDKDLAGNTGSTTQSLTLTANTAAAAFAAGNLVLSISGDGDGSGVYGDNQASPATLEQITTSGDIVSQIVMPGTTEVVNGVTEYALTSEYGSSSEGALELAANGESLVMAGYGVNATDFNEGGAAVYGNAAEAQSTSIQSADGPAAVPRVIGDVNADGAIDTSTALNNVYNTNNPRSVATVDGSTFYVSGQGDKNATSPDQGVFAATDGSSTATAINTVSDTRDAEIYNGSLYVSMDSKQDVALGGSGIYDFGSVSEPSSAPTILSGMTGSVTLTAAEENTVNASLVGASVNLSPENFFFANATTLYVADGGAPKEGGLGDGGLQKWTEDPTTGVWSLQYTLSEGLNLIANTSGATATGDTGLIGLTGEVLANGEVELYATTEPLNDLGTTSVVAITDQLGATAPSTGESFATVLTATAGENIRGISFAPTADGAPRITGVQNEMVAAATSITPFAGVAISDADLSATDTLVITVAGDGYNAGLIDHASSSTLTPISDNSYTLSGTASAITTELDALTFTAPSSSTDTVTTFTLTDESSDNGSPTTESFTDTICFMAGTMIATPDGEVAVETLERGDLVMTSDGRAMPVSWLGRQTVSSRFSDPLRSWPVRVKAGALGDNVPCRDLLLSPDHALLVGDVLVHAGALVNGTSIVRETRVPEIFVYYHVELDDHALILAQGAPAETFVDNVDRLNFDNWAEHEALHPQGKTIEELPHPRAKARRQVPAALRSLLAQRALRLGFVVDAAVA